jgi:hypothetical protein
VAKIFGSSGISMPFVLILIIGKLEEVNIWPEERKVNNRKSGASKFFIKGDKRYKS